MWGRGGSRVSALDRAKAHLSGQRISGISQDTRHVGHFGTAAPQAGRTPFLDLSDASSTSQNINRDDPRDPAMKASENFSMGGGSRFLKKTSRDPTADGPSTPAGPDKSELIPQRSSQSAALSRLSLIENRFKSQKAKGDVPGTQTDLTEPREARLSLQSSSDLSMTGSRFLKKKPVSVAQEQKIPEKAPLDAAVPALNERKGRRLSLDSDEQDMQRLLGDSFSLSEDTVRNVRQRSPPPVNKLYRKSRTSAGPSPAPDRHTQLNQVLHSRSHSPSSPKPPSSGRPDSRRVVFTERSESSESDHSEIRSLDDLFPVAAPPDAEDTVSERSAASDDFKLHVLTLDDLASVLSEVAEVSHEKIETTARKEVNIRKEFDSPPAPQELSAAYESDFESEVPSEGPPHASEISEHLTDEDRDVSMASEAQHSSYGSQDEDLASSGPSRSSGRHRDSYSESSSRSDSSDATLTLGPSPAPVVKEAAVQTHTDGLTYTWSSGLAAVGPSLGMTYVDPTPIASHTVSAEAIESLTSYSPAVFALNDMLRQQLALTRAFITSSRHHYTSVLESLGPADYRYTTLEDTKEFIRTHRPPKLSIEEALEEVLQDMRDYHYI